jgi:hypothetical protein
MNRKDLKQIAADLSLIDSLTPRDFELLVAFTLESFGWQVSVAPATRDAGYDIIAVERTVPGLDSTWILECKKYSSDKTVGVETVRTLLGVSTVLGIGNAVVVTANRFSKEAIALSAHLKGVKLIDRKQLESWILTASTQIERPPEPRFKSVFISYSSSDEDFAQKLHSNLVDDGIRAWFAPKDVKGGQKLHDQIFSAINVFDKLLLVLSKSSIQSEWVMTEIRKAREIEKKEGRRKLFPIRLLNFSELKSWSCFDADTGKDLAVEVREYFIPDFSGWKDAKAFETTLARLKQDLRAD